MVCTIVALVAFMAGGSLGALAMAVIVSGKRREEQDSSRDEQ